MKRFQISKNWWVKPTGQSTYTNDSVSKVDPLETILVKFESNVLSSRSSTHSIIRLAEQTRLKGTNCIKSFVSLRRNTLTFTFNSGPHVHKKARDQYSTCRSSAFFVLVARDPSDIIHFLALKNKLYYEFEITLTRLKKEKVCFEDPGLLPRELSSNV